MSGSRLQCLLREEKNINSSDYDGIILVSAIKADEFQREPFKTCLNKAVQLDKAVGSGDGSILEVPLPARRMIFVHTGSVNGDYDDVRKFGEAAKKGVLRALKAGVTSPLLVILPHQSYPQAELVTVLGALEALYVPLQLREDVPEKKTKIKTLSVLNIEGQNLDSILKEATALESGRVVARDIGGGDPERMAPPRVECYVRGLFPSGSNVTVEVISNSADFEKDYPLFAAVNRAANVVQRHNGRIIYLTYNGEGEVKQTLFLVGKGITYDTGGADIKAGGVMAGMSRDKCGAAAVAGFMQTVSILKPKGIRIVAAMCLARNSVGEECYVADEVITARSKLRVRVGNTDAEGRMVMADVLCRAKEMALRSVNPHLMTIATLTGHACLTVGEGYAIIMDNGPARKKQNAQKLQGAGEQIGDMFEISTIRREDLAFHAGKSEGDDVHQSNNLPSSRTPRGHQGPAGFLLLASGLNQHGNDSRNPLPYTHLDIAAAAGDLPKEPTGAPILGLTAHFLKGLYQC